VFQPPRCPYPDCPAHDHPDAFASGFCWRNGQYRPRCRPTPVPRYKCRACRRSFSRQTFRADYCDNKPYLNAALFRLLASGMGLRQSARILNLSRRCTELKARKISRHLGRLNRNLTGPFAEGSRFMLDEMETFEGQRAVLPVTVPVLIEAKSLYVITSDVATIRPSGKMSTQRRRDIARAEARHGRREDRSRNALGRTMRRLRFLTRGIRVLEFASDKKQLYCRLLRQYFGERVVHLRVSSRQKRDQTNPLRHINLTNAMARDLNGRLRRESWLVSKARRYLRLQLYVFAAYRNFIRRRVNRAPQTPAEQLGFLPRPATFEELLGWRQDWKERSVHPMARRAESIAQVRARRAA